jgi:hypothetical protein
MTRPGLHPVALVALAIACSGAVAGALTANDFKGKNVVLFLSDQVSVCTTGQRGAVGVIHLRLDTSSSLNL